MNATNPISPANGGKCLRWSCGVQSGNKPAGGNTPAFRFDFPLPVLAGGVEERETALAQ